MDIQLEKKKGIQKRHLPYLIGGAALLLLVVWIIFGNHASTLKVDGRSLNIAEVTYGEFNDYIRVNGQVQPISIVQLSPEEGGIVREKVVEEGAHVKQGDVILRLSNSNLDLQILNAESELAEKQKKQFAGCEISGKKLGIIGLGAIGAMVANAACGLGMEVYGYDPYLSIDAAWNLSRTIKHSKSLDEIYSQCDYITIHVPLLDSTKKMINKEAFDKMKDGVVLLNFARDLLVDEDALIEAVESGKVKKYVTDFANETVAGREGILVTPHLGASTEESEENCAEMAVKEIRDYLENGNIKNSVNYPNCDMGTCVAVGRISLAHSNTPNMISQVTKILGSEGLNIADMTNKSKGEFAYTLIDLESAASAKALDELKEIEGMYRVRVVK